MRKLLIISILIFCGNHMFSQQLPHFSQYFLNDYLINPAVAGSRDYFEGVSTHRYQWEGVTDAPRTYTLSVNGPTKNRKMGLGGYLFTDHAGPTRRTGFSLSYAYHLKINDGLKLGLGLNAGHDLSLENLKYFNNNTTALLEVSIGHALISDALYYGLENTIQLYKRELIWNHEE